MNKFCLNLGGFYLGLGSSVITIIAADKLLRDIQINDCKVEYNHEFPYIEMEFVKYYRTVGSIKFDRHSGEIIKLEADNRKNLLFPSFSDFLSNKKSDCENKRKADIISMLENSQILMPYIFDKTLENTKAWELLNVNQKNPMLTDDEIDKYKDYYDQSNFSLDELKNPGYIVKIISYDYNNFLSKSLK